MIKMLAAQLVVVVALLLSVVGMSAAQFCTSSCPWEELRAANLSANASVALPGDTDYFLLYPTLFPLKQAAPAAIALPATEADVVLLVRWAARNRARVVVRCSGHDMNGRSTGFNALQVRSTSHLGAARCTTTVISSPQHRLRDGRADQHAAPQGPHV